VNLSLIDFWNTKNGWKNLSWLIRWGWLPQCWLSQEPMGTSAKRRPNEKTPASLKWLLARKVCFSSLHTIAHPSGAIPLHCTQTRQLFNLKTPVNKQKILFTDYLGYLVQTNVLFHLTPFHFYLRMILSYDNVPSDTFFSKNKILNTVVISIVSAHLACGRPWIWSPGPQDKKQINKIPGMQEFVLVKGIWPSSLG
jgi:hypothetical protein